MKIARFVVAGIGVGLCLCTIAKGDDAQISNTGTVRGPVVIKRIIVVRSHGDRMIYVRPAYAPVHASLAVNRSWHSSTAVQGHRHSVETSDSADTDNHGVKTVKPGHSVDTNQSRQEADKDNKSADRKPEAKQAEAKQPEAKQPEAKKAAANQSEDVGALDRLTVQAQKEQAILPPEPGGVEPK
jgi:flagellar biosynthesis GTPase FlhF